MTTAIDPQQFRDVLGHYPTGVSVITALAPDGQAIAMVVGTFTSVSLDPPLVAFLPSKNSSSFEQLREADAFVVNILAHDQEDVVRRLARSDRQKMDVERWSLSAAGNPVLDGVVASIECDRHSILEAGDHFIVLGEVKSLRTIRPTIPLLFFRGGYGEFAPKSLVMPDGRGMSGAVAQAQALRGELEVAAAELGGEVTVFAKITGDTVALASAAASGGDQITPLGARYPIAPPIGAQYIAWSDEREQDIWIDRAVGATQEERAAYRRHLDDARQWGWSVNVVPDEASQWPAVLGQAEGVGDLVRGRHAEVTRRIAQSALPCDISDIDDARSYQVIGFMAPIFVAEGAAPELMVRLLLYPTERLTGADVRARGAALTAFTRAAASTLRRALAATPG